MKRQLRRDLPFRRIAVILAGGGALGAYETGVLRALGRVGLDPAIVAGASAGALNAVCWVAADLRTEALEDVWRRIEPATIGMHWGTLAWRTAGAFLVLLGAFEMFLSIIGSPELNFALWFDGPGAATVSRGSALLDALAWAAVLVAGILVIRRSRETEEFLAWASGSGRARLAHDGLAIVLVVWVIVHAAIWALAIPWPHRFSATLFAAALVLWLASKPGHVGAWVRRFFSRLLPESRGRGLWGDEARREVLEDLVTQGSPDRLTKGAPILILTGLALDTGRVAMFVAGTEPTEALTSRADAALAEVVALRTADEVVDAAIASSAIPMFFEPSLVRGREYIDAVALSTHPLRAALFADADAALVVVVAPSGEPPPMKTPRTMVELWGRYLDIANWRDFQQEMRALPEDWHAPDLPRRLCVVEPGESLPGGVLAYSPGLAEALINRGETDAWRALDHAGWLET